MKPVIGFKGVRRFITLMRLYLPDAPKLFPAMSQFKWFGL